MKDHSQGDLNEFLRSKLSDSTPAENGWNVPPSFVFNQAMSEINERKKKKNRRFFLIMIFGIGVFLLSAALIYSNLHIKSMEEKVSKLELTINDIKSKNILSERNNHVDEQAIIKNETDLNLVDGKDEIIKKSVKVVKNKQVSNTYPGSDNNFENNNIHLGKSPYQIFHEVQAVNVSSSPTNPTRMVNVFTKSIEAPKLARLDFLDSKELDYSRPNYFMNSMPEPIDLKTIKEANKWTVGLMASENFTCLSMTNVEPDPNMSLTEYDKRYMGNGMVLTFDKNLNDHWSIGMLTAFNRYNNKSTLLQKSNYDIGNEVDQLDGTANYVSQLDIITPLGSYAAVSNFSVTPNTYTDNDVLNNETKIIQSFDVISFGMGLKYNKSITGNVNAFIGSGVLYNRILRINNNFGTTMTMDNLEMDSFESHPEAKEMYDISKSYISWQLELGLIYSLNNRLDFVLSGQGNHSISSLRKINNNQAPSTYIHNLGVNIGSRIKF